MYAPSVYALCNAFVAEPVATAGYAGLTDVRHTDGALKMLVEYRYLQRICYDSRKENEGTYYYDAH